MIRDGGLVALLAQNNSDEEYQTKTQFTISDCAWLRSTVIWCILKKKLPCYNIPALYQLEQLERLRSEDTPHRLMITHTIESYWIPSQKKTKSKLQI